MPDSIPYDGILKKNLSLQSNNVKMKRIKRISSTIETVSKTDRIIWEQIERKIN